MQAAILPFFSGWRWIAQGYRLFLRQPMALFLWSMTTAFLILASYLIFPLGQLLLIAVTPILSFVTLNACRHVANGQALRLPMWLAPLRARHVRARLIKLGLTYLACCLTGGFLAVVPFASQLMTTIGSDGVLNAQALEQAMIGPLLVFLLCYVMISALFWHAPALIGWHDLTLPRALFFSMVACWRNKWPFLLYGLSWGGIFFAVQSITGWMLETGVSPQGVQWFTTPIHIGIAAILYCSFYPTYVSVFGAQADNSQSPGTA